MHVAPPPRSPPSLWGGAFAAWGITLSLDVGVLTLIVMVGQVAAVVPAHSVFPTSSLVWAASFPIAFLAARAARPAFGARAGLLAALLGLLLVPVFAAVAFGALSVPLIASRTDYGDFGIILLVPFALFAGAVVAPFVAFPLAWKPLRVLPLALRALAAGAGAAVLALVAFSAVRAARAPDPDAYVRSLPLLATLPAAGADPRAAVVTDRVRLARREGDSECAFDVTLVESHRDPLEQVFRSGALPACGRVGVRRDDANALWIFTNEEEADPSPILAIESSTHASETVPVSRVAGSLSPPRGWIAEALAGVLVAAFVAVRGRRAQRALAPRVEAVEALHVGGGMVSLGDDVPPFLVEAARPLVLGPVLLVGVQESARGAYRESAVPLAPREVVSGTRATAAAEIGSLSASSYALALASIAIAATPLVVAATMLGG